MKTAILNNIHQCKSKRDDVPMQQLTHKLYTFFQNHVTAIFQDLICWHSAILCFLQILYPIANHIFNK